MSAISHWRPRGCAGEAWGEADSIDLVATVYRQFRQAVTFKSHNPNLSRVMKMPWNFVRSVGRASKHGSLDPDSGKRYLTLLSVRRAIQ